METAIFSKYFPEMKKQLRQKGVILIPRNNYVQTKSREANTSRLLYDNYAKKLIFNGSLNPKKNVMNKNTANNAQNIPVALFFF